MSEENKKSRKQRETGANLIMVPIEKLVELGSLLVPVSGKWLRETIADIEMKKIDDMAKGISVEVKNKEEEEEHNEIVNAVSAADFDFNDDEGNED